MDNLKLAIIISIIGVSFFLVFWLRNRVLFFKVFGRNESRKHNIHFTLDSSVMQSANVLYDTPQNPYFSPSLYFSDYTVNILIKCVLFVVVAFLLVYVDFLSIPLYIIEGIITVITIRAYIMRKKFIRNELPSFNHDYYLPYLKASLCMPLYQCIVLILMLVISFLK